MTLQPSTISWVSLLVTLVAGTRAMTSVASPLKIKFEILILSDLAIDNTSLKD